jgi:glutamine synthetase
LESAAGLLSKSRLAKRAFSQSVVDYHLHTATLEVQAFNNSVTDWEKFRYFERI